MNLKLIESFAELIELGAFANKEDIAKGLKSAIKFTKESAELTDEEIIAEAEKFGVIIADTGLKAIKAILRKASEK